MARIFLSSTFTDLVEYRRKVLDALAKAGHAAVGMEYFTASDRRPLAECLAAVEDCDVYVGVIAWRLGFIPEDGNPEGKSITELELRHAQARRKPCLVFLLKEGIPWLPEHIDDGVKPRAIDRLRGALAKELTVDFFTSPDDLATKVLAAVGRLQPVASSRETLAAAPEPRSPRAVPPPPALYAVPPYTLTDAFVGRRAELAELDAWAASADPVLVVEAIGGMGKSALTWEWVNERAPAHLPGLAGRVWWSFYERGTSMKTFLRHALAYVTGQEDPEALEKLDTFECGQQLLAELQRKPYLLVLDGFERVLSAYHVLDKAQIRDEKVAADKRECVNPKDGDVLLQLVHCEPSKVLVSTRLLPKVLEDRATHQPMRGVRHLELAGLAPEDALRMVRHIGIRGNSSAILPFAEQIGRHPLVLRIVCGMITNYRPKPGDFDAWHADPYNGGGLKLGELPMVQRNTHILEHAFRGLGDPHRQLLSRIAALSDSADYGAVSALNPFLPTRPEEVTEPDAQGFDFEEWEFERRLAQATSAKRRKPIEAELAAYRAERARRNQEEKQEYDRYQEALRAYYDSAEYHAAIASFHVALGDLEDRGLLQWGRDTNTYDLHPVVRAYAFAQLEEGDRTRTYGAIRDYFASLPPEKVKEATELAHVKNSLEIVRALIGAGRLEEAMRFYRGELSRSLLFSIGAYSVVIELLEPLVRYERKGAHQLADEGDRSYATNDLANALSGLGRLEEAILLYQETLRLNLDRRQWTNAANGLSNLAIAQYSRNRLASAERLDEVASELAAAAGAEAELTVSILDKAATATTLGRFDEAESLLASFEQRERPPFAIYQPGYAEYWHARLRFYQGRLTEGELDSAELIASKGRSLAWKHSLAGLRAEWELTRGNPQNALTASEQALAIVRRTGEPAARYLELRILALARLGRTSEAEEALAEDRERSFPRIAAETYLTLGDRERAREAVREAYTLAWADGPPYSDWYELKRCREIMAELGEPEPQLPPFDPSKVEPIPFEAEIRAAIAELKAEAAKKQQ